MKYFLSKYLLSYFYCFLIITVVACKKDAIITDHSAKLEFSTDTVVFDTVFSTIGSTTHHIKVYNRNKKRINISSIKLAGGSSSPFRMNVDGVPADYLTDIEIAENDSMYVFVEVTINPTGGNLPFVVEDAITFITNDNTQSIQLVAWGQDAYFYYNDSLACNTVWANDKPHVIYGFAFVDSACSLTIDAGANVYSHNNSGLFVKGSLIVNGTVDNPVFFQADRLESFYDDVPGQWLGIFILRSDNNNTSTFLHAVIKNSLFGVSVGSHSNPDLSSFTWDNAPSVIIEKTTIQNVSLTGVFGFLSTIQAKNSLIYNCGEYNAQLVFGGLYDFNHVTMANYSSAYVDHKKPVLQLGNFAESSQMHVSANLDATFTNCIVYGGISDEIEFNDDQIATFDYQFENCLLRTALNTSDTNYVSIIKNTDPLFVDVAENDYHLKSTSLCIDAGKTTTITDDLEETARDASPDIGAYEYVP